MSYIDNIFNTASPRGFFKTGTTSNYDVIRFSSAYTINPNFIFDVSNVQSGKTLSLTADVVDSSVLGQVESGDFATVYYGETDSVINNNSPILLYKVINVTGNTSGNTGTVTIEVDRNLPNFNALNNSGNGRVIFYPSGMTELYDSFTPEFYWQSDAIDFESNCDVSDTDVKVWNMNIPWTESPAGVMNTTYQDYTKYDSKEYVGTKEYLGYNSNTGQTDTSGTYYYNSFSEMINLSPSNQKSGHCTLQIKVLIIFMWKLKMQPFDGSDRRNRTSRNFKITIPWLMCKIQDKK